jgi:hypothetical protein
MTATNCGAPPHAGHAPFADCSTPDLPDCGSNRQPHASTRITRFTAAAMRLKAWVNANGCDVLIGAVIVISGVVGYAAIFLWLGQLASHPMR